MTAALAGSPTSVDAIAARLKAARVELADALGRRHVADRQFAEADLIDGQAPDPTPYEDVVRLERVLRGLEHLHVRARVAELESRAASFTAEHQRLIATVPGLDRELGDVYHNRVTTANYIAKDQRMDAIRNQIFTAERGASNAKDRAREIEQEVDTLRTAHPEAFIDIRDDGRSR